MDDGPVFVGMAACRLGFAPSYEQCEKLSKRLGDTFEDTALIAELWVLGVKPEPEPKPKKTIKCTAAAVLGHRKGRTPASRK